MIEIEYDRINYISKIVINRMRQLYNLINSRVNIYLEFFFFLFRINAKIATSFNNKKKKRVKKLKEFEQKN